MLDLVVIGAGLSGLTAALTAADAGLRVRVIAKGLGAMHWSAGTVDVLGYLPGETDHPVDTPLARLNRLPDAHPYRLVGVDHVQEALAFLAGLLADNDLPYADAAHEPDNQAGEHLIDREAANLTLPSPVGAPRPTLLAPAAQLPGRLDDDTPFLVVGFQGLRDFYPELIAENLIRLGHQARAAFLPLELITERRDSNTVQLATGLETPSVHARLGAALAELVQPDERIGLPAILGVDDHRHVLAALRKEARAPVFEIPTLPPSVPGIRLYRTLRRLLQARGVRVEAGMEVVGFDAQDRAVRWVETATSARPLKHRAQRYLLATGGVLGGGFTSDHNGGFREVVFNLPLTVPQDRAQWFRPEFLDRRGHQVFQGGVAVDAAWQPVDPQGRRVLDNVWAAGNLLAHADGIVERSLEGIALATGVAAAHSIIKSSQG